MLHRAVDLAEYAGTEDFVEQVLPELDVHTPAQLWALCGMLYSRGERFLARFVGHYARHAEAMVWLAIEQGEADRVGRPRQDSHRRDYMPSPLLLWGEWRARQGYHDGRTAGWEAKEKHDAATARKAAPRPLVFLHNWNPTTPS
jgi:hypothetical protein